MRGAFRLEKRALRATDLRVTIDILAQVFRIAAVVSIELQSCPVKPETRGLVLL